MVGLLNMPDQWSRLPDQKMDVFYHKILGVYNRIKKHSVQKYPQLIMEKINDFVVCIKVWKSLVPGHFQS